jgi:GTP-binding protein Era
MFVRPIAIRARYYPADQLSEVNMRFIAAEVIREKIILNTEQEIPHSVAVAIEGFKERDDNMTYIDATIYVERDSQKGIIVGKGGATIKQIGMEARKELAEMLGTRVYTDLHVKVLKNWRRNIPLLRRLGYRLPNADER